MSTVNYWLMKTEPETFSYADLKKVPAEPWSGVRNYQARNHMKAMTLGDLVLIYHSGGTKEVVGVAKVVAVAHQDPTTDDPAWQCVDVAPVLELTVPVSLAQIKQEPQLADMVVVRNSRLSVQPVRTEEFHRILHLGRTELP